MGLFKVISSLLLYWACWVSTSQQCCMWDTYKPSFNDLNYFSFSFSNVRFCLHVHNSTQKFSFTIHHHSSMLSCHVIWSLCTILSLPQIMFIPILISMLLMYQNEKIRGRGNFILWIKIFSLCSILFLSVTLNHPPLAWHRKRYLLTFSFYLSFVMKTILRRFWNALQHVQTNIILKILPCFPCWLPKILWRGLKQVSL